MGSSEDFTIGRFGAVFQTSHFTKRTYLGEGGVVKNKDTQASETGRSKRLAMNVGFEEWEE